MPSYRHGDPKYPHASPGWEKLEETVSADRRNRGPARSSEDTWRTDSPETERSHGGAPSSEVSQGS